MLSAWMLAVLLPGQQWFQTPEEALRVVLATKPRVLALGELHQVQGHRAPSALARFTTSLAKVSGCCSDLIVETWYTEGECGAVEQKTVAKVTEDTQRPKETPNEILALGQQAKRLGIRPWALTFDCEDYRSVFGEEVDYGRLLTLITQKLNARADEVLKLRAKSAKTILIYGGAQHNDLKPPPDHAEYAFGAALHRKTQGRYVALDMLVPQYIPEDSPILKERWFAKWRAGPKNKVALIKRKDRSWVLLFARTSS